MIKRTLFAGAVAIAAVVGITSAEAKTIDLGFIMDSSGSVGSSNFNLAMTSLGNALAAYVPVTGANTYTISVITFGSSATVEVSRTVIDSQATLDAVVNDVKTNNVYNGSTTNYRAAFDALRGQYNGLLGDDSLVNMMTDGEPCCGTDADAQAWLGRDALKAAGWDSLSFEAVDVNGTSPGGPDTGLLTRLGFDTAGDGARLIGDASEITNPLNDAFVLTLDDFADDYSAAIDKKVQRIITPQVPVPAALPLLAAGIGVFGFVGRRRRRKAA